MCVFKGSTHEEKDERETKNKVEIMGEIDINKNAVKIKKINKVGNYLSLVHMLLLLSGRFFFSWPSVKPTSALIVSEPILCCVCQLTSMQTCIM